MGNHGKLQKLPQETFVSLTEVKLDLDTFAGNVATVAFLKELNNEWKMFKDIFTFCVDIL